MVAAIDHNYNTSAFKGTKAAHILLSTLFLISFFVNDTLKKNEKRHYSQIIFFLKLELLLCVLVSKWYIT